MYYGIVYAPVLQRLSDLRGSEVSFNSSLSNLEIERPRSDNLPGGGFTQCYFSQIRSNGEIRRGR